MRRPIAPSCVTDGSPGAGHTPCRPRLSVWLPGYAASTPVSSEALTGPRWIMLPCPENLAPGVGGHLTNPTGCVGQMLGGMRGGSSPSGAVSGTSCLSDDHSGTASHFEANGISQILPDCVVK